jgi:hypothetical protein
VATGQGGAGLLPTVKRRRSPPGHHSTMKPFRDVKDQPSPACSPPGTVSRAIGWTAGTSDQPEESAKIGGGARAVFSTVQIADPV